MAIFQRFFFLLGEISLKHVFANLFLTMFVSVPSVFDYAYAYSGLPIQGLFLLYQASSALFFREREPNHFLRELNYCYLNEDGRKIFIQAYHEKLKTTITHQTLGRKVSYQRLIRIECYKIVKHLLGEKLYEGFKAWW
jgi:hypothetical protein